MNNLKDLQPVEVSLVSKPANLKKFLIFKSEEGSQDMEEILKTILETDLDNETAVEEILKAGKLSDKGMGAVKGALKLLSAYKEELPGDIMGTLAKLSGYGYPPPMEKQKGGDKMTTEKIKNPTTCKKSDGSLDLDGVPEDVKPVIEALWKEHNDAITKAQELEKALNAEKDERVKKEYIAKASELDSLKINAEEFGLILKSVAENIPDKFDEFMKVLKSANEVVKQSEVFKEIGSSGNSVNSAWGKIENLAKSIVQKDSNMTQAQAITKVMEDNPDLYTEYLKEGGK